MRQDSNTGSYMPSFFVVKVEEKFASSGIGFEGMGNLVLAHELVHFLQDFTTVIGMRGVNAMTDRYANARQQYGLNGEMPLVEVHRPIRLDQHTMLNHRLLRSYRGVATRIDREVLVGKAFVDEVSICGYPVKRLICELGQHGERYHIGSHYLLESMADAAERVLGSARCTPHFPYHVDEAVLRYCGHADVPPNIRLLLLEHVLQTVENPAPFYYWMVDDATHKGVNLAKLEEVMDFLKEAHAETLDGSQIVPASRYSSSEIWVSNLEVLIQGSQKGCNVNLVNGIRAILDKQSGRYPVTTAVMKSANNPWAFCLQIFNNYVGPLVVDSHNEVIDIEYGGGPIREPRVFPALLSLDTVLYHTGDVRCELVDVCSKHNVDLLDHNCTSTPWARPRDGGLCMFDRVLMANGLHHASFTS